MRHLIGLTILTCAATAYAASDAQFAAKIGKFYNESKFEQIIDSTESQYELTELSVPNLNIICQSYLKTRRYAQTMQCLEIMQSKYDAGDKSLVTGFMMDAGPFINGTTASALTEMGRYDDALEAVEGAVNMYTPPKGAEYMTANPFEKQKAVLLALTNRIEEAKSLLAKVDTEGKDDLKKMFKRIKFMPKKVKNSMYINHALYISQIHMALQDFEGAYKVLDEQFPKRKFKAMKTGNIQQDVFVFPSQVILARASFETGRIKDSKKIYTSIISKGKLRSSGELYVMALYDLGRIALSEKDLTAAKEYFARAIDIIEQQRATIHAEVSKIGFAGDNQLVYRSMIKLLFEAGQYDGAFNYVERSKSRALVDMLASQKDFSSKQLGADNVRQLISQLTDSQTKLMALEASLAPNYSGAVRGIQVSHKAVLESDPELASLVTVSAAGIATVQQQIQSDEVLLEYYQNGDDLLAFVVTAKAINGFNLDGSGLNNEIQSFRKALNSPDSTNHQELGKALYERLLAPLAGTLTTANIIIVPHGALHYLPFAALSRESDYVVDQFGLRVVPSASVLQYLQSDVATTPTLINFGNPDLNDSKFDLPGAQDEVMSIAAVIPDAETLIRKEASETRFKSSANAYDRFHVAAHGVFNEEQPLQSGLLLSPDEFNDGMLTASELYSLNMKADLVTLSACETGLGSISKGDDIVGLTRGFLYAGVDSIVSSLWKVDDEATAQLMQRFYIKLATQDKRSALRHAQLETKKNYPHPFYWAAFQLTGSAI